MQFIALHEHKCSHYLQNNHNIQFIFLVIWFCCYIFSFFIKQKQMWKSFMIGRDFIYIRNNVAMSGYTLQALIKHSCNTKMCCRTLQQNRIKSILLHASATKLRYIFVELHKFLHLATRCNLICACNATNCIACARKNCKV